MSIRAAKFVMALFVSLLAGVTLTTISQSAVDDCLSGPKDKTPEGSHWYYRIDRVTKRHCWYLRQEDGKPLQITAANAPSSPRPVLPDATMQRSIADARASLPSQTRAKQQENNLSTGQQTAAAVPLVANIENSQPPSARDTTMSLSVIASRWPGEPVANPPADPAPGAGNQAARPNSTLPAQPPAALAAGQHPMSDLLSKISAYSLSAKLAVLMAALSLAGVIASAFLKTGSPRRPRKIKVRSRQGSIWEPTDDDRIVLSAIPDPDVPLRTGRAGGNREARVEDFFARLSRRAPRPRPHYFSS